MSESEISEKSGRTETEVHRIVGFLARHSMLICKWPEARYRIEKSLKKFLKEIQKADFMEKT